jgi:hypothetical protein
VDTTACWSYTYGVNVYNCYLQGDYRWWDSNTGWHETGYGGSSSFMSNSTTCIAYTIDKFTHYANLFCPAGTTFTNYYDNEVYGDQFGRAHSATYSYASGQCTNLLHSSSSL